jgi:arylsulfatase A-like enzyme
LICSGVSSAEANSEVAQKWNYLDFRNGSTAGVLAPAANQSWMDYSAFVLAEEATRIALQHAAKMKSEAAQSKNKSAGSETEPIKWQPPRMQPLFLYMAMQSVHEPLQAPAQYVDAYAQIGDERRRTVAAMVTAMDDAIGMAVDGWKKAGLWNDTILVFSTGEV